MLLDIVYFGATLTNRDVALITYLEVSLHSLPKPIQWPNLKKDKVMSGDTVTALTHRFIVQEKSRFKSLSKPANYIL